MQALTTRLRANEFRTNRGLFPESPDDPSTSHLDNLGPGFIARLRGLRPGARILSSGCGTCRFFWDLWSAPDFPRPGSMVGLLYSRQNVDTTYFRLLEEAAPERFQLVEKSGEQAEFANGSFDLIEDDNGWFAYARDPKYALEKLGRWLAPDAYLDTVFETHILIRNDDEDWAIRPGLEIVDEHGENVTLSWFRHVRGLEVVDDTGRERESPWLDEPYLDIRGRSERLLAAAKGEPVRQTFPGGPNLLQVGAIKIYDWNGLFIHTGREQINHSTPITLRRTPGPVVAPELEEIECQDGRPPIRRFRWRRG